ncbi:MAG: hypothetical protein ACFB13_07750 [Kiloniellaceae bacterium]
MVMQQTMPSQAAAGGHQTGAVEAARPAGHLFHPVVDFLCLGGGSLIVFALLAIFRPPVASYPTVAVVMMALANLINHPHFAHSYQIFYRNFGDKAFGSHYDPLLRLRYLFAGVAVPLALLAYFVTVVALQDLRALGFAVNIMAFLVGWHYVKQGYGMLIVCSVLKRQFFNEVEKKILLLNAYAVWMADWMMANWLVHQYDFWGLAYYTFGLPQPLVLLAMAVATGSSAAMLWMLARKWWASDRRLPINGVVAYLVTLYAWLMLNVDPLLLLVIPACHSLQYLLVVWRYQINADRARARDRAGPTARFIGFVVAGLLLGYLGFWGLPKLLSAVLPVDQAVFGPTLLFFICWVFINVHHYCLDNVMWRRGNPDTARYLFSHH